MAKPIEFKGHNCTLTAEGCLDLPVYRDGETVKSCWKLTPEELEEVQRTGEVWVEIWSGPSQPPIFVSGAPLVVVKYDG